MKREVEMQPRYHLRPESHISKQSTANPLLMYNMEEYSSILHEAKSKNESPSRDTPIKRTVYAKKEESKSKQSMEYSLTNPIQMKVYSIPKVHESKHKKPYMMPISTNEDLDLVAS